jgi:hypothetical protein
MVQLSRLVAAALALVILAGGPPPARAQEDESADLLVELVGLPLPVGQQQLTVRVTNVSVWWADATHLRIETLAPVAGNVAEIDVENLDPGQVVEFSYTLAAPCDGHVVKAEVSAAPNYAGVPEADAANNMALAEACPPPAAAPAPLEDPVNPDETVDYGGFDAGALERLRPVVAARLDEGAYDPYTTVTVAWQLPCETDGDARGPCTVQGFLLQQESPLAEWWVGTTGGLVRIFGAWTGWRVYDVYFLAPNTTYQYRVCAVYHDGHVCPDYASVTTL